MDHSLPGGRRPRRRSGPRSRKGTLRCSRRTHDGASLANKYRLVRFQMHNTPFTSILTADAVLLVEEDILAAMKPGLFVVIVGSHDYNVNNRNLFHRNGTFAIQLSPEQGDVR